MNKDIIKGHWHEVKGKIMQTWSKITHDKIIQMKGTEEELRGLLERQYGYSKERAEKEVASFVEKTQREITERINNEKFNIK